MNHRVYSFGDHTYKLTKAPGCWRVLRWDPLALCWKFVDCAPSKRHGRHTAAKDAYSRGINP